MDAMRSVLVLEPVPTEIEALIQRRQALGQDRSDEVWEGVYHMAPGPNIGHALVEYELVAVLRPYARAAGLVGTGQFNLGEADDYRVPDGGYHRGQPTGIRLPTAAIVVEILSPGDETYDKFSFYLGHDVEEIIVADPSTHRIEVWARHTSVDTYSETGVSVILGIDADDIGGAIDWPPT